MPTLSWQMTHHIRRHRISVCPTSRDTKSNHLVRSPSELLKSNELHYKIINGLILLCKSYLLSITNQNFLQMDTILSKWFYLKFDLKSLLFVLICDEKYIFYNQTFSIVWIQPKEKWQKVEDFVFSSHLHKVFCILRILTKVSSPRSLSLVPGQDREVNLVLFFLSKFRLAGEKH